MLLFHFILIRRTQVCSTIRAVELKKNNNNMYICIFWMFFFSTFILLPSMISKQECFPLCCVWVNVKLIFSSHFFLFGHLNFKHWLYKHDETKMQKIKSIPMNDRIYLQIVIFHAEWYVSVCGAYSEKRRKICSKCNIEMHWKKSRRFLGEYTDWPEIVTRTHKYTFSRKSIESVHWMRMWVDA